MNNTLETIQVPAQITEKWQEIIDLLAEVLHVPSAFRLAAPEKFRW